MLSTKEALKELNKMQENKQTQANAAGKEEGKFLLRTS